MDIVLYAFTVLLYGGLCAADWRALRRASVEPLFGSVPPVPVTAGPTGLPGADLDAARARSFGVLSRALLFVALAAHGLLLHMTIFPANEMIFGFAFALSAMFWLGAVIYWIESFFFALDGLRLLLLPLAALASILPLLFGGVRVLPYAAAPLFKLHFVIANVAYGLFAIAALHAVLMLAVERRLHALKGAGFQRNAGNKGGGWLSNWIETLPPLLTMEKLLFRLIGAGFVLLTATLVSGIVFSEQLIDRPLSLDHKTVFAFLSWLMFGTLLTARKISGWRGRSALRWVIASFVALLLAYVGSRFVFEVLLHRPVV
ncbi:MULTISPECIES: inner membrane protein YpjD [unclassified Paraburkholderia]|uniref:cytochrome C assembly family protein n=1 Tax=unclassified Paraburkholderia TaxID=2615204 RepID=UPI00198106BB|nr:MULTISPECIES: cytochrome c biogenesis protein CcsA [unclassified Paraburkholderia]MBN3854699.1 cytochrome c biogenesis protein CcsA [Paraburkholderia sp. Ac-20340]